MRAIFALLVIASAMAAAWLFAVTPRGSAAAPHSNAFAKTERYPEASRSAEEAGMRDGEAANQTNELKLWIVAGLIMPDGNPAFMTFHVPDAPDLTLKDCEGLLPSLTPVLKANIARMPSGGGAKLKAIECFLSASDPIKPRKPKDRPITGSSSS